MPMRCKTRRIKGKENCDLRLKKLEPTEVKKVMNMSHGSTSLCYDTMLTKLERERKVRQRG